MARRVDTVAIHKGATSQRPGIEANAQALYHGGAPAQCPTGGGLRSPLSCQRDLARRVDTVSISKGATGQLQGRDRYPPSLPSQVRGTGALQATAGPSTTGQLRPSVRQAGASEAAIHPPCQVRIHPSCQFFIHPPCQVKFPEQGLSRPPLARRPRGSAGPVSDRWWPPKPPVLPT